jgi:hypothetical protein
MTDSRFMRRRPRVPGTGPLRKVRGDYRSSDLLASPTVGYMMRRKRRSGRGAMQARVASMRCVFGVARRLSWGHPCPLQPAAQYGRTPRHRSVDDMFDAKHQAFPVTVVAIHAPWRDVHSAMTPSSCDC